MRPPPVLATVTLATVASIAGLALGVGAVATHPSHDGAGATPMAAPAPLPAPAMSQTSVAPARPAHPDPALTAPAAALAPRPPADGRDAPDPFVLEDRDR